MRRREFLALGAVAVSAASGASLPEIALFSKPLDELPTDELGRAVRGFGLKSLELTVRPRGHVLPERVREDLPRAVETLASHGVSVPVITTAITSASQPHVRAILETAARLGIPSYRLGYWRYGNSGVEEMVERVRKEVRGLVALSKSAGIQAGWHNHSGDYVGHSVWDIHAIIADMDPAWIGYFFDLSHAATEGSVAGWHLGLRLAMPRLKLIVAKDHAWNRVDGRWRRSTTPLGEGMVDFSRAFSMLASAGYRAPVSLAVEYDTSDIMRAIARDAEFLQRQISQAYRIPA